MIGLVRQPWKGDEKGYRSRPKERFIGVDGRIVKYYNSPTGFSWMLCLVLFIIGIGVATIPMILESVSIVIGELLPAQISGACFGVGLLWMLIATGAKGV